MICIRFLKVRENISLFMTTSFTYLIKVTFNRDKTQKTFLVLRKTVTGNNLNYESFDLKYILNLILKLNSEVHF